MTSYKETSPTSVSEPSASRLTLSDYLRRTLASEAKADGASNTLHVTASSGWWSLNKRFLRSGQPGSSFEIDMHDRWFTYFHASINIPSDHPAMDRLVLQIVQTKEMGVLKRVRRISHGDNLEDRADFEVATTSDGVIWKDLPFLVADMADFWENKCASMSTAQRLNFSTFLAKVSTTGVDDRLCGIALIVLRDTLETARVLGDCDEESHDENPDRSMADLSVVALLPAAMSWLSVASWKMIQLSDQSDIHFDLARSDVGPLVHEESTYLGARHGFSIHRWIFWLKRLEQLKIEAEGSGNENSIKTLTKALDTMIFTVQERESHVRTVVNSGSGAVEHRPVIKHVGRGEGKDVVWQSLEEY